MSRIILTLMFLSLALYSLGQTSISQTSNPTFIEMLVVNDKLFAINNSGQVSIWDLKTLNKEFEINDTAHKYTTVSSDKFGKIYFGTSNGQIFKYTLDVKKVEPYIKLKNDLPIIKIIFNSSNELFLIVPYSVSDPIKGENWTRFKQHNRQLIARRRILFFFTIRTSKYLIPPQYIYIDNNDIIWMTSTFGEWGGSIQRFDTKSRKVINRSIDSIQYELIFPRSIFEDDKNNIYITSGLQHFYGSGEILKIYNNVSKCIYSSDSFNNLKKSKQHIEVDSNGVISVIKERNYDIFVGPGAYNEEDNKIYFASSEGFFRVNIPQNGKIQKQEFLFKPNLNWENEPLAIGVAMTIKKIAFTSDNRLIFLTTNNGIGIYDGANQKMLK